MLGSERQRLERLTDPALRAWGRRHIAMLQRELRRLDINEAPGRRATHARAFTFDQGRRTGVQATLACQLSELDT